MNSLLLHPEVIKELADTCLVQEHMSIIFVYMLIKICMCICVYVSVCKY